MKHEFKLIVGPDSLAKIEKVIADVKAKNPSKTIRLQFREEVFVYDLDKDGNYVLQPKRNRVARKAHRRLDDVTAKNIGDQFSVVKMSGKIRIVHQTPAAVDANARTMETQSLPDFLLSHATKTKNVIVEYVELDPKEDTRRETEAAEHAKAGTKAPEYPPGPATKTVRKIEKQPIAKAWFYGKGRPTYDVLTFQSDPTKVKPYEFNMWNGFTVKPYPGDWQLMRRMMFESLANGDQESFDYILRWVAWAFQYPTERAEAALVIRSELQGTGKGILGNTIRTVYGSHGQHVYRAGSLTARFNSQLEMCGFMFDDESSFAGDKSSASVLKGLITEPDLVIERKGIEPITLLNCLKIYIATNAAWAAHIEPGDRRHAVFEASEEFANDQSYFGPIIRELEQGGRSAMLHDLLAMDLTGWHPRDNIPKTAAKADQQELSLAPEERWLAGFLTSGMLPYATAKYPSRVRHRSKMYEAARAGIHELRFGWHDARFLKFLESWGVKACTSNGAYLEFGSLQEMRDRFVKKHPWFVGFKGREHGEWEAEQEDWAE